MTKNIKGKIDTEQEYIIQLTNTFISNTRFSTRVQAAQPVYERERDLERDRVRLFGDLNTI